MIDKPLPMLEFTEALKAAGNKIFQFTGRSRRSEYWWTMLVVILANLVLTPFGGFVLSLLTVPLTFRRLHDTGHSGWWYGCQFLLGLVFFVVFFADMFSLVVFRGGIDSFGPEYVFVLLGKYLLFIILILVYKIVLIVFLCLDSDPEPNRYGPSPKYSAGTDEDGECCRDGFNGHDGSLL